MTNNITPTPSRRSIDDVTPAEWDRASAAIRAQQGRSHAATAGQPVPKANANPAVWSLVVRDMAERDILGTERYATRLQPGNGRDALTDAYQEALDLVVYLRQAIWERDEVNQTPKVA